MTDFGNSFGMIMQNQIWTRVEDRGPRERCTEWVWRPLAPSPRPGEVGQDEGDGMRTDRLSKHRARRARRGGTGASARDRGDMRPPHPDPLLRRGEGTRKRQTRTEAPAGGCDEQVRTIASHAV